MTVRLGVDDAVFRASGKTIDFAGFQRAYVEGSDDPEAELADRESVLPPMAVGEAVDVLALEALEHATQPPARFTDATLVKELDLRGIGRPSTWASIIAVLLDRGYAFRKSNALVPTFTGFAVVRMLKENFGDLLDYEFTARMEDDLDAVSRGEGDGRAYLRRFYLGNGAPGLKQLVESGIDAVDPRAACRVVLGEVDGKTVEVRVGKFGLFVTDGEANASIPDETVPDELGAERAAELLRSAAEGPRPLGQDPETGKPVYLKSGPYGPYIQLGDGEPGKGKGKGKGVKPKMVSVLPGFKPEDVDLALALRHLSLPRDLGPYPDDPAGGPVEALTGRYGPYVRWGKESRSIPAETSVLEITLDQAVELLRQPRRRGGATVTPLKDVGQHPESGAKIQVMKGRYGPYVTDGTLNASLPKGRAAEDVALEEALELLRRRAERVAEGGGRRGGARKPAAGEAHPAKKEKPARKSAKKKAPAKRKE
jgi:DNA topoisomerase-1